MHSSIGIRIEASPERVIALAGDITRWPELLPHYRRVTVHGHREGRLVAQMMAVRAFGPLPFPVTWRTQQWSDTSDPTDLRLRFCHVRGVTKGMDVTWHIRARGGGSDVTIEHEFQRSIPLIGSRLLPAFVDRFFTRPIAGRTLATFKCLAEREDIPPTDLSALAGTARVGHPTDVATDKRAMLEDALSDRLK